MADIIRAIAKDHDVLIFHPCRQQPGGGGAHHDNGRPAAGAIAGAGFAIEAMVSVDSAFLHAAAAFGRARGRMSGGPTDGRTFTRHHKRVKILWHRETFGCAPCCAMEDLACSVSAYARSARCVAAIRTDEVLSGLTEMLGA